MRSKYSNVLVLLAAILAFVPVIAVDYLLDSYIRLRETAGLQRVTDLLAGSTEAAANDAIGSLEKILADSPSLCTPTFISNAHAALAASLQLRDVLVENPDGVQYCDALGEQLSFTPLSADIPIPGRSETVEVVKTPGLDMPLLKVTSPFGESRRISAFVPVVPLTPAVLLDAAAPASMVRISLSNGASVLTAGDAKSFDKRDKTDDFVSAQSFSGEMPIRVDAAVPFATVRAGYATLDMALTLMACGISGILLLMMLQYVRRSTLPAFDLEHAIAHGELKPYYQPVIDLSTGRLVGCEMLCRWVKKNGEVVLPGAFIDYAETTGLAIPMTVSLMQQVRADLAELCRDMPDLKVNINLFDGHFRDGSIVEDVQAIFGGTPINFRQLVFEITERRPLGNSAQAHAVIAGLHALGARIAMDDAGTGHSNLAYLQTLGIDVIKIDRVFVDMIKPETRQVPVLDGLIAVARDLGTDIVAEGVETEAQARYLRAHGVVQAQGYLFAPALKAKLFKELARALNMPASTAAPAADIELSPASAEAVVAA